jgi:hypothetical protein
MQKIQHSVTVRRPGFSHLPLAAEGSQEVTHILSPCALRRLCDLCALRSIGAIYDALYLKLLIDTYDLTSKKHVLCTQIESRGARGLSRSPHAVRSLSIILTLSGNLINDA